jgi:hypothetical protein
MANTSQLCDQISVAPKEVNSAIYEHAKEYISFDDKRTDSIISRGQGLLVAQAFLGALLSFGGTAASRAELVSGWRLLPMAVLVIYLVIQTFLLTLNARHQSGELVIRELPAQT